jgi:hypothetical protein
MVTGETVATAGASGYSFGANRPIWDFVFNRNGGEPILQLKSDGTIIVTGDHDEAVRAFLAKLETAYGSLPQRLKEAESNVQLLKRENASLNALCDKHEAEIERLKRIHTKK